MWEFTCFACFTHVVTSEVELWEFWAQVHVWPANRPLEVPVKEVIAREANARFPEEACGFVLSNGSVVVCENVAEDPLQSFQIHPDQARRWWPSGQVVGVWHSHCFDPAVPSERDEALAQPDMECWIYSVTEEDLGVYRPDEEGRLQLLRME